MKKWDVDIRIQTVMRSDFEKKLFEKQLAEFIESFGLGGRVRVRANPREE